MKSRSRILISALVFCHALMWPGLFTTELQLHASAAPASATESLTGNAADSTAATSTSAPPPAPTQSAVPGEEVTIHALEQEKIGDIYHLRGNVEIYYRTYIFKGDYVTYNSDTGDVNAKGHLLLDGGPFDEHIEADHGTYNLNTDRGRLYDVRGTIGIRLKGVAMILTSSTPFSFTGRIADLEGRDKIIVHHGTVTSCKLPDPHWELRSHKAVVVPGKDAKTYNTTFLLWRLPVFYFPFIDHAITREARKSGFLMPEIGQSSVKGTILGDAFFWAINRSFDTTAGLESYSSRGWAERFNFRGRPADQSFISFRSYSVEDRGTGTPPVSQGGTEARFEATSPMPYGFRGVANIDYLSSLVFREVWSETFWQAINSEVQSTAYLTRNDQGYSFNLMASRYQNYWSATPVDLVTIQHTPSLESSTIERNIGDSHFLWAYEGALDGVSRTETAFHTGVVGRLDAYPYLAAPFQWHGWSMRPQVAVRDTFYSSERPASGEVGSAINSAVNRKALDASFELRPPALSRIFEKPILNHTVKHTIEPRMIYRDVTGINNFYQIIRFDYRDILTDTNQLEYGITNRIYFKNRPGKNCSTTPSAPEKKPESNMAPSFDADEYFGPMGAGSYNSPFIGVPGYQGLGTTPATPLSTSGTQTAATVAPSPNNCETPPSRELLSWDLVQEYYFEPYFGGALVPGARNVFTTTVDLTGLAFLTSPRHFSPIVSRLRMRANGVDIEWHLDYDTVLERLNGSTVFVNKHLFQNVFFGAGHSYLHEAGEEVVSASTVAPIPIFNQFRLQLQYGSPNRRGLNAGAMVGYDSNQNFLQYSTIQTTYNWDCCGVTFEYRRFALGVVQNENQYRFALTLTNVGTFGNLRRQERLF